MESTQTQIIQLNTKVDIIYDKLEELVTVLSETLPKISDSGIKLPQSLPCMQPNGGFSYQSAMEKEMEHKDILSERDYTQSSDDIAPEIQIRRLTAQLTAAYNRIAALEEQLLARRVHQ